MSIIIKKENGMFNMYQNEELIHENLKVVLDKRKGPGEGDIRLPENSLGKTWLSTTKFQNGITEVDLANMPARAPKDPNKPQTIKESWVDHLTEEEKAIYEDLKTKATERMAKAQKTNQFMEMAKNFTKEELLAMLGMNEEA
jgi:hypothetical protein